jgi:hypothetical protein
MHFQWENCSIFNNFSTIGWNIMKLTWCTFLRQVLSKVTKSEGETLWNQLGAPFLVKCFPMLRRVRLKHYETNLVHPSSSSAFQCYEEWGWNIMKPTWCTLPRQVLSNVTKSEVETLWNQLGAPFLVKCFPTLPRVKQEVMFRTFESDRQPKQTNHLLSSTIIPSNHGGAHNIELSHLHLINSRRILAMFTNHHFKFRGL